MIWRRLRRLALQAWLPALVIAFWYYYSENAGNPFFPPLSDILVNFKRNWLFSRVGSDLWPSVWRFLAGFALATVAGISVGTALGLHRGLRRSFRPTIDFLRSIPVTTLVSAFIIVLGFGHRMNIAFIAWAAFFPILLNTIDGVLAIEPTQRDLAKAYRIPLRDQLFLLILPAASPQIFVGMRISLAVGLLVMVFGEMVSTQNGLGFFILFAQNTFRVIDMWSGIFLLGLLGYAVNLVFIAVERRVLAWHRGWRASVMRG